MIHGAYWGRDEEIVFGTMNGGLFRISSGGGEPEALTTPNTEEGEVEHVFPRTIEGSNAIVFTIVGQGSRLGGELAVLDLQSGEVTRLGVEGISAQYVPTGHLVYVASDRSVRAVPFDVESLTVIGSAVPLLDGITVKGNGAADVEISDSGHLVYLVGPGTSGTEERSPVWVDRAGREEPIGIVPRAYVYPRISPDGGRLALDDRNGSDEQRIWIWDFATGNAIQLYAGAGTQYYPAWTPNGERLVFSSPRSRDLYWKAANNTGDSEVMVEDAGGDGVGPPEAYFLTPDGEFVVLREQDISGRGDDLIMLPVGREGEPVWRLGREFYERNAVLSPDGRWMAYQSDESGQYEIYVRPFPDVDRDQVLVSNNGGVDALWSRDGSELFYLRPFQSQLVAVPVEATAEGGRFRYGERQVVLDNWPYYTGGNGRNYDVSLDGQRFVVIREGSAESQPGPLEIQVVLNWFEELKERMGS